MKEKYDESQIKRHPRRTRAQNKQMKQLIHHLDLMFGERDSGMFLSMICDALDRLVKKEIPSDYIELRTIEIRFNDFYSVKLDCETEEYIDE